MQKNTQSNQQNNPKIEKKHLLAGPWIRLFSRILDFVFISAISFAIGLSVFINSSFTVSDLFKEYSYPPNPIVPNYLEGWRILLLIIISFILTFFYFICIPYFTKGYTLFKYIFKIKIVTKDKHKNFLWLLFKHEFLLWILNYIFLLTFGLCCTTLPSPIIDKTPWSPAIVFSSFLFNFDIIDFSTININAKWWVQLYYGLATFIKLMISCCSFIPACLFFYMIFHKNKQAPQDIASQTYVCYVNRYVEEKNTENESVNIENQTNSYLPGIDKNLYKLDKPDENKVYDNTSRLKKYNDRKEELDKLKDK